jgi:hypothetical protein
MELQADGIGGEGTARQPSPFDRALALFDPLLCCAALVVESDEPRNCSIRRRSKSSLRTPRSASPGGSPIPAPSNPPQDAEFWGSRNGRAKSDGSGPIEALGLASATWSK